MTLQELYKEIDGNYENILERLQNEERIRKFVLLFLKDESYHFLIQALEQGNIRDAFRAAHTLKGVCLNLSFDSLFEVSSRITEHLRAEHLIQATVLLPDLEKNYKKHVNTISLYAAG